MIFDRAHRPLIAACLLLGVGFGGFFDGILFHQILQLHSMLSNQLPKVTVPNMEVNMFWDGLFHAFTWTTSLVGLFLLWRAVKRPDALLSNKILVGGLLGGWGLFNIIEGILDHHILEVHHVVDGPVHVGWDLTFLGAGVALFAIGIWMIKGAEAKEAGLLIRHPRAA